MNQNYAHKEVLERKERTHRAGHQVVPRVQLIQKAGSWAFTEVTGVARSFRAMGEKGKWVTISRLWGP